MENMMEQKKYLRIFWEKTEHKTAKILRVFGSEPFLILPEAVEGFPVTEIGNYCFAENCHLPETYFETVLYRNAEKLFADWETAVEMCRTEKFEETCGQESSEDTCGEKSSVEMYSNEDTDKLALTTISGNYLEEITLPENLEKIGNLAFYNCTSLKKITLGKKMEQVGSDAFMNCRKFSRICLNCGVGERSGIRQILSQISSDMEVTFCGKSGVEAVVFYPEYYESYDEIAPAHLFGRNIEGEGFRARQCFKDGIAELMQYDTIFPKACVEENEKTLRKITVTRLRYPVGMNGQARQLYEAYFTEHGREIAEELAQEKKTDDIRYFCEKKLLLQDSLETAIQTAAAMEWAEGTAALLHMKQEFFAKAAAERYAFEEF